MTHLIGKYRNTFRFSVAALCLTALVAIASSNIAAAQDRSSELATGSDVADCFGDQSIRRAEACTRIIEMPGIDASYLSRALAMRALSYSLSALYDEAIRDYDAALKINPNFAVALNNRAWAHFKRGDPDRGLPDVERALTLDPLSAHAYDTRAHILRMLGNSRQALSDFNRALRLGDKKLIELYQCGLRNHGVFDGPQDGVISEDLYEALKKCMTIDACDPLPPDEECRPGTS